MSLFNQTIPTFKKRLLEKQAGVRVLVAFILKKQGKNRKWLAEEMHIHETSLSRMLSSIGSNLTLETISKMEVALNTDLLVSPQTFEHRFVENEQYREYLLGFVSPHAVPSIATVSVETTGSPFQKTVSMSSLNASAGIARPHPSTEKSREEVLV